MSFKSKFTLIALSASLAVYTISGAWLATRAQQPAKVPRIGFLRFGPASAYADRVEALRTGLRDLGYIEGKSIVIEFRWADRVDQLPEFAAELARMNYGPDFNDLVRRAATYIDKILKGEKVGELPLQLSEWYELVINLKTAKALGLSISEAFLLLADEVIE